MAMMSVVEITIRKLALHQKEAGRLGLSSDSGAMVKTVSPFTACNFNCLKVKAARRFRSESYFPCK